MRAYLDHASTSPLRPEALAAMQASLREHHGDPGRVHAEGRAARVAVEQAREQIAACVGARPREVVLTSGGTEAVNAAVWGALARGTGGHVVTTAVEHSSVLESCERGATEVTIVAVDARGRFDADAVAAAIRDDTVLVSVQLANHEVGTLQPVADVAAAAGGRELLVHVDACAAAGHVPWSFHDLGADLGSVTAHKLGGPTGTGALLVRRGLRLPPFVVGGAQERARRAGMEHVAGIVGFGAACEALAGAALAGEAGRARAHVARLAAAARTVPGVSVLGDPDPAGRLPHILCVAVDGLEAEPVLLGLDQRGVAVHSGSSCASETLEPSPVLAAMGADPERSLRLSVGWSTTDDDVERFARAFPDVVAGLRSLRA